MTDSNPDCPNEITAAARDARAHDEAAASAKEAHQKRRRWPIASIGIGIGSAALTAAFLYAGRNRDRKK
ncbi:hypothetical protein ACFO8O_01520 [Hephaestia sp. GCM10023244]|uniref:hypothetical protein n=1 Tax=unclassified Hephaestia TaxID=2631281 RepID=UPI002077339B|nr:hypothetical protein [Hephaestia sp. MAHUQ-44]MCM8729650.1 hypothetical protein [Hephaestia sp. MAHUQ-44]